VTSSRPVSEPLVTLAEPTRLRILNCLSTAPLFPSDLASMFSLPEATIVEHLDVLERLGMVRTHDVVPYVLYALSPLPASSERLVRAVLDAMRADPAARADRIAALARSRSRLETRVGRAALNAS
jgi:DNA-binding transcriptional ArsR family regulator